MERVSEEEVNGGTKRLRVRLGKNKRNVYQLRLLNKIGTVLNGKVVK